jgi:hypothetical protein
MVLKILTKNIQTVGRQKREQKEIEEFAAKIAQQQDTGVINYGKEKSKRTLREKTS